MWTVFGGNGWIGSQFVKLLEEQGIEYDVPNFRLDHIDAFKEYLQTRLPDRVVCLIGRTSGGEYTTIDYLELGRPQLHENVRDNLFAPLAAALVCQEYGIHFTYMGTGCIFSYDSCHNIVNNHGFREEDTPNFFGSAYSIVKGFTDRLMHLVEKNALNLRIRMPINDDISHPRNFIKKLLTYEKICSIQNSMSVLPDLLPIMIQMIQEKKTGTYNMTNPGTISHNQILDMYTAMIDPSFTYQNFSIEEQSKILKAERSNNMLETSKLENEYFILPIYQSLQRLFKRIRKNLLFEKTYVPTRLLVTGGYGFIGSNFLHHIVASTPSVKLFINIDKTSYCSRVEHLKGLDVVSYEIDINETEKILSILREKNIDTIVHFAAQSHVDNSFGNSISFTMDNTRGTHSLLEASKIYGRLQRFIHISTDEVYGENLSKRGFYETELPNPTNPYAATKIAAEFLVQSYYHCFELPVIIIRGNNVYGPRQYPEKVISKFIVSLLSGQKCTVQGNGYTRRNFIYVNDFCHAVEVVMKRGQLNHIYNIGTDNEHSVLDIARTAVRLIHGTHVSADAYVEFIPDRYYNDFTYRINCEKLHSLGWKPKVDFEQGMRLTCRYYIEHLSLFTSRLIPDTLEKPNDE